MYSPIIGSIKVIRSGKVKKAKLYYLRKRKGKSARISEKIKKTIGIDISEQTPEAEVINETKEIDTVVRLIPGVLGNPDSLSEESFEENLLEYPQYTKPQKWE